MQRQINFKKNIIAVGIATMILLVGCSKNSPSINLTTEESSSVKTAEYSSSVPTTKAPSENPESTIPNTTVSIETTSTAVETESESAKQESTKEPTVEESTVETFAPETVPEEKTTEAEENKQDNELTKTQWNSISMLNYLTVLSQEVNASTNSRLFLESAYSSLINNTYPNAVDVRTEAHLEDLLDILHNYRMISVKRDRLQYIYEQNRAKAMREAIPNPMGLLSAVQSGSLLKSIASVVYMAADAYSSYSSYVEETDLQYLMDGWELDDEQDKEVHNTRSMTFSYMLDMVRTNNLPGDLALNETSVAEFVSWKNNPNPTRRIQFLESNKEVYQALGEYWLVLATSYYENANYQKCLDAIQSYESIDTRIFRKDYDYAKALPLAIVAAKDTLTKEEYIAYAEKRLPLIDGNSDSKDWAIKYFVAETYLDLYSQTKNKAYLQEAYSVEINVVNSLIDTQKALNNTYLNDVAELTWSNKGEKKEVQDYNKMLKEQRKVELPPISDPLLMNCELLLGIAEKLDIAKNERQRLNGILYGNGEPLFLNVFLNNRYSLDGISPEVDISKMDISLSDDSIELPAVMLTKDFVIKTIVKNGNETVVFDDWKIEKVDRKNKNLNEFIATFKSSKSGKYSFEDGMEVVVAIFENKTASEALVTASFRVVGGKKAWVINTISFERTK